MLGTLFAVENNSIFLGKQLLVFPVGYALAVSLRGIMPPDLPPNFPCLEELSWVKAPGKKLPLFVCIPFVPRSPGTLETWWEDSPFYIHCRSTVG